MQDPISNFSRFRHHFVVTRFLSLRIIHNFTSSCLKFLSRLFKHFFFIQLDDVGDDFIEILGHE